MKKNFIETLLIIVLTLGIVFPLFRPGFFEFHDNTTVVRVFEMTKSLQGGMFPVRWVEDLGYGYGYPIFNFYGPTPYYIGSVFNLIGFDVLFSTKIMLVLGMLFSSLSMFYLVKKLYGVSPAIVSSVFYAYFPYHAVNLYVRGAVGELFAYAFLPLVFLSLFTLIKKTTLKTRNLPISLISTGSFGIFLTSTSHNLTALMLFVVLVPLMVLLFFVAEKRFNFLVLSVSIIIIGLLLSSFYIIPAVLEMKFTNVTSQVGGGADFSDHYICLTQLWDSQWGFGGSTRGCLDGLSFKLGKVGVILLAFSFGLLSLRLYNRKFHYEEKVALGAVILVVFSVFLTLPVSKFLWEALPFMEYIQYPWRFLNFISLGVAVLIGYLFFRIPKNLNSKTVTLAVILVVFLLTFSNQKLFNPQFYTNYKSEFYTNEEYIKYTVSKISDEYMPKSFQKPQSFSDLPPAKIVIEKGIGIINDQNADPFSINASYVAQTDLLLHLNLAYFPAWKAKINGNDAELKSDPRGMKLEVSEGAGTIGIKFIQTPVEKIANALSTLAFLGVLIVIMLKIFYGKKAT